MSSRGKKKTTFAKLNRETRLRERRLDKQARKEARKLAPQEPAEVTDETVPAGTDDTAPGSDDRDPGASPSLVGAANRPDPSTAAS
jgi:hypothetical protein